MPKNFADKRNEKGWIRAGAYALSYAIWVVSFKLVILTLMTYFLMSSNFRFQDISDTFANNEVMVGGAGALLFTMLLIWLNPITSTAPDEVFTPQRFEKRFSPGFWHGAVLALGVTVAFLLSGLYRYYGVYVQMDDGLVVFGAITLRIFTLIALAFCEEFIFRYKILNALRKDLPDLHASLITALLYCGIKALQFDLGIMQLLTLFLIALTLAFRMLRDEDFMRGAGLWAGLIVVFQAFFSLSIFGSEFQGILLVKYQVISESESSTYRFLTGGAGGPLSSFALQLLFLFDVTYGVLKNKKILLKYPIWRLKN
ncbi:hypothetical protein K2X30_07105 [bacterium]|jgi:membrane protease YdiL (CAAX protease family)|nr:hypothetical protein [bacterium]